MPWLRRLVAGLSLQRPRLVHVGFVVDKVALGQIFLQVLWFSPHQYHSIVALHTHVTEMNSRPTGGCNWERQSHPIDMNMNIHGIIHNNVPAVLQMKKDRLTEQGLAYRKGRVSTKTFLLCGKFSKWLFNFLNMSTVIWGHCTHRRHEVHKNCTFLFLKKLWWTNEIQLIVVWFVMVHSLFRWLWIFWKDILPPPSGWSQSVLGCEMFIQAEMERKRRTVVHWQVMTSATAM
jgi:hypothetical protein